MPDSPSRSTSSPGARLSLASKGIAMLAIPLVFQLGLTALFFYLNERANSFSVRAGHARDISGALHRFGTKGYGILFRLDDALDNHVQPTTVSDADVQLLRIFANKIEYELQFNKPRNLQETVGKLHRGIDAINQVRRYVSEAAAAPISSAQHAHAVRLARRNEQVALRTLRMVGDLGYFQVLLPPEYWSNDRSFWLAVAVAGTVINVLILLILAVSFNRGIVNRLLVILDNSLRLAAGRKLLPKLGGADEISQLDRTFHDMADALGESLRRQRSLTENAHDVICSLTESGIFLTVNAASLAVFGYKSDELVGSNIFNLVPDADAPEVWKRLIAVKSREAQPFETRLIRKDRKVIDVRWSASWSEIDQSCFCVIYDISQQKGAERLRQEVMQMVSHDLRSPLTTVQAFQTMMDAGVFGKINDQGQRHLASAQRCTTRMLHMIEDLLEIEQMEVGALQLHKSEVSVKHIIDQAIDSVLPAAKAKGVLLVSLPTDLTIIADQQRIIQVLVNLLTNAIKFSQSSKKVTVSAAAQPDFVELKVTDEGRGIPEPLKKQIFERFKQVKASDAAARTGFGLGLAICRALVELHGGEITVESTEGVGSTFAFKIPRSGNVITVEKSQSMQRG